MGMSTNPMPRNGFSFKISLRDNIHRKYRDMSGRPIIGLLSRIERFLAESHRT